jgi:O-acetylserine/cysteine efflux transporter
VAAPVDAVLSLAVEGPARDFAALRGITLTGVGAIAFVAYGATLFGFGSWSALLRRYGASTVTPFAMLAPVCAVAAGALLLGQPVRATDLVGGAAVLCGLGFGLSRTAPDRRQRAASRSRRAAPAPDDAWSATEGTAAPAGRW